jgi:hypothetical protein
VTQSLHAVWLYAVCVAQVLFVRDSIEKRVELQQHGYGLPRPDYDELTLAVAHQLLPSPSVVLQTSSSAAFSRFADFAHAHGLSSSASANPRSRNDMWGGMKAGAQTIEGVVAAVNLHLAARAQFFVGLSSSAWTFLVVELMDGSGGSAPHSAKPLVHWCCGCGERDQLAKKFEPRDTEWLNGTDDRHSNVVLFHASGARQTEAMRRAELDLRRVTACSLGPVRREPAVQLRLRDEHTL